MWSNTPPPAVCRLTWNSASTRSSYRSRTTDGASVPTPPQALAKATLACSASPREPNELAAGSFSKPPRDKAPPCAWKFLPSRPTTFNPRQRDMIRSPMKKPEKIRILIVDDHYIVRMGLISLVDTEPDMEVVAEADDGDQALDLFARHQPDLVLLDLRMPGKSGIHTATEIRAKFPAARILMLSAFGGSEDIHRALQAGVQGYVLKSSSGGNLVPALLAVAA